MAPRLEFFENSSLSFSCIDKWTLVLLNRAILNLVVFFLFLIYSYRKLDNDWFLSIQGDKLMSHCSSDPAELLLTHEISELCRI